MEHTCVLACETIIAPASTTYLADASSKRCYKIDSCTSAVKFPCTACCCGLVVHNNDCVSQFPLDY